MATQYMSVPAHNAYAAAGPSAYSSMNGYQNASASKGLNGRSFAFRKRYERIDWRRIASVDIDQISRTLDFGALQENIMNITFCNIESELDLRMLDPNFVKLFKLSQLTIEYLLHSQEYLTGVISNMEEKFKKEEQDHKETKDELEKTKQQLADIKKESHKRKKLLMAQQQLIHAGSGSYNKCPFCPKAFLNSSFLQSHISRRHADYPAKAASVAVTAADQSAGVMQPGLEAQIQELKARLQASEAQLRQKEVHEQPLHESAKLGSVQVKEEDKKEIEVVKEIFMKELKEVNEKYQSAERSMMEMEQRHGKRSNLGELQDDTDVEKDLLLKQREEVALLKEQLQDQIKNVEGSVSDRLERQERQWQKKMMQVKRQHAEELQRRSGRRSELTAEDEIEQMLSQEQAAAAASHSTTPRGVQPSGIEVPTKLTMEPSDDDDDDDTEMKSGSFGKQSMHSTMESFRSGEITLRTTQFLEELRKNPTLKLMRDELVSLLQQMLDKIGIPPETRGIPEDILLSKLALLKQRRQTTVQKYPIFPEFRRQCNAHADQLARERLKEIRKSPPLGSMRSGVPPRPVSGINQNVSASGVTSPPRPTQQSPIRQPTATSPPRPQMHSSPPPRMIHSQPIQSQQPPKAAPRMQSPKRMAQSTGSTSADWTSTQWDSAEEEEDESEDDEPVFQQVRMVKSGPPPRVQAPVHRPQSQPVRQQQQPSVAPRQPVQVRGRSPDEDDDWDDSDVSDLDLEDVPVKSSTAPIRVQSSPARNTGLYSTSPAQGGPVVVQPKGKMVAALSQSIEMQLAGRKTDGKKPAGAVDTMGGTGPSKKKSSDVLDDFNSDSDWDVSPFEDDNIQARNAPKKGPTPVRSSHATDTSNTFDTDKWGSSSKAASTVAPGTHGRASRSSFVSVTDVSSDDELNLDNI